MKSAYAYHRPPSPLRQALTLLLVLLMGGAGTLGALAALDVVDLSYFTRIREEPPPAGKLQVPLSVMAIPAYTKITREHLFNAATSKPDIRYMTPEEISQGRVLHQLDELTGLVLNHDKPKGYVFTEKDFFPKGTRSGLVAAVDPGKRAIALDASKIQGVVYGLKAGDRLDLLSTGSVDLKQALSRSSFLGRTGDPTLEMQAGLAGTLKQAFVTVLVHNGVVITPVQPPDPKRPTRGLKRPGPEQEILIGVAPEEITPLTQALGTDAEIICVARSGHPDEVKVSSSIPESRPELPKVTTIDTIVGSKRNVQVFPVYE